MIIAGDILTLKVVAKVLGYKNRKSVIRWCLNNGVRICNHHGTNRKFVIAEQFNWVRIGQYLQSMNTPLFHLKVKTGDGEYLHNIIGNSYHENLYLTRLQSKIREL